MTTASRLRRVATAALTGLAFGTVPALASAPADPPQKGVGIDVANIDKSVNPCENFFQYASGNWMKNNPVPATEVRWGSFNELINSNNATLRAILNDAAAKAPKAAKGSNDQKVGDFYASAMDSVGIEKAGLKYLQPYLDRINNLKTLADVQKFMASPTSHAGGAFYGGGVGQDDKNSTQYAIFLGQGGLSLPDRDYYLKDDPRSRSIQLAYETYLVNTFKRLGDAPRTAEANAKTVLRIEKRLAQASKSRVDLRDPYANYNKMTLAEANTKYPNLALPMLLKDNGAAAAKDVIVGQPDFFVELNKLMQDEPLADLKTYMRWHLVTSATAALPKAYGDEAFRFAQTLSGAKQQQPRWKRMLGATDRSLGEAFGQLYVDKAFSPASKAKAKEMIENLRLAYAERIMATDWMSADTKAQAVKKLNAFVVKIGYPDQWKDYSTLNVNRASYLQNMMAASEWRSKEEWSKYGKPVDRNEWHMTPPTVNAYYNPGMNEIVFPAGILQSPFYDAKADDAVNYGAIGAVIGHEMTHGFDDQGRQYDAEGNLKDWWTKEDAEKFNARAAVVGKQFSAFSPLDSVYVNGDLTMGENLADLGGLTIAYQAFQKTQQAKENKAIDGFSPNQRFFLAYAQVWRTNARPEYLRQQVQTDPHSPAEYRTNGPLMNMPEFFSAFGCQPGAKMVRPESERAKIW